MSDIYYGQGSGHYKSTPQRDQRIDEIAKLAERRKACMASKDWQGLYALAEEYAKRPYMQRIARELRIIAAEMEKN